MGRVEGSEREKFNITGQTDRVYLRLNLLTRNLFTILTLLVGGIQMLVGGNSDVTGTSCIQNFKGQISGHSTHLE